MVHIPIGDVKVKVIDACTNICTVIIGSLVTIKQNSTRGWGWEWA